MPTFIPSGSLVQSTNGKVITFTDTSTDPPDNLYTRKLIIADGRNAFMKVVTMQDGSPAVSFTIDKDAYLNITLVWVDDDLQEYRTTINQIAMQFFNLALLYAYEHPKCKSRGCGGDDDLVKAVLCKDAAITYFGLGQSEDAQLAIESANLLIKAAPDGYGDSISKTIPITHELPDCEYDDKDPIITVGDIPITLNGSLLTL